MADRKGSHGVSLAERLWANVDKTETCWNFTGFKRKGYGSVWWQGASVRAHRASWTVSKGPIPDGLQVLHACDNPGCVRPSHLFLGTNLDNVADRHAKDRDAHPDRRGERGGRATLTEAQVCQIRESAETNKALALQLGVDPSTISDIRRRKSWSHLV